MPRSRTASPTPPGPDISNSFVPGLTLTHHSPDTVDIHAHSNSTSNSVSNSGGNKKQKKYMKPRIGSSFQAKVEPFQEEIAKATLEERKNGMLRISTGRTSESSGTSANSGNNGSSSSFSVVGGEYGVNGGVFASVSNNGYGTGTGNNGSSNGNGKRKRAGRPPKGAKATKGGLFQNSQPIHYDPIIRPPCGGLCIHRPIHYQNETNNNNSDTINDNSISNSNNNSNNNNKNPPPSEQQSQQQQPKQPQQPQQPQQQQYSYNHDHFLTFARNIMLQTTSTKQNHQYNSQYKKINNDTHSYQRIDYLYNNVCHNKGYGDRNVDGNVKGNSKGNTKGNSKGKIKGTKNGSGSTSNSGTANNSSTINGKKKRGRKRKVTDLGKVIPPSMSATTTATTAAPDLTSSSDSTITNSNIVDDSSSSSATITTATTSMDNANATRGNNDTTSSSSSTSANNINDNGENRNMKSSTTSVDIDMNMETDTQNRTNHGKTTNGTTMQGKVTTTSTTTSTTLGLENDELFLEYLQRRHNGNVQSAQLQLLSDLCRGRAIKTRRHHKKMKKEEEMNVPLSAVLAPLSDSWRRRYARMGSSSTILGDYRNNERSNNNGDNKSRMGSSYPFFDVSKCNDSVGSENDANVKNSTVGGSNGNGSCGYLTSSFSSDLYPWMQNWNEANNRLDASTNMNSSKVTASNASSKPMNIEKDSTQSSSSWGNNDMDDLERDEGFMKIWKSILQSAQAANALTNDTSASSKDNAKLPKVRDLLVLLGKAYSLPKPEDVFGRRDSISKQISQALNSTLDKVEQARGVIANLTDAIYDKDNTGIELNKLRKTLDRTRAKQAVHIEEVDIMRNILNEALAWESKLSQSALEDDRDDCSAEIEDLNLPQQSLASAEEHALSGRSLSLRPRSLVTLDNRIQRAYELRNKIRDWSCKNNANEKDSVKYVSSMIREANQINLGFPELSVLSKVHRNAEEWVDRASVALRSKISLDELESLVETGEKLPLGLTGTLEKLTSRYKQACEWIAKLRVEIPCPLESLNASSSNLDIDHRAEWLLKMLESIKDDDETFNVIIDLSAQGSRLPTEIDIVQLLQTAIDSRNWSLKAKKWVPNSGDQFKRGKIDDLRDHLESAETIIKTAEMLTDGKIDWCLDFEKDVSNIVEKADEWYEKYESYLESDRRSQEKCIVAFAKLEQIINDANSIHVNLGSPFLKINRMYSEAKSWIDKYKHLLTNCGIQLVHTNNDRDTPLQLQKQKVLIDDVNGAIEAASKDLSIDLEEVEKLKELVSQSQDWFDRAIEFAPKRNKRLVRGKKDSQVKHSIEEVVSLIDSAGRIPMDTSKDLERLRILLSDVQSWRLQAQIRLREIIVTFDSLREERIRYYGLPENFLEKFSSIITTPLGEVSEGHTQEQDIVTNGNTQPLNENQSDSEDKSSPKLSPANVGKNVYRLITNLVKSAESISIFSFEEQIAEKLDIACRWCKKVAQIIASNTDVYTNKRWKRDLELFINEAESLQTWNDASDSISNNDAEEMALFTELKTSVFSFISGDVERLKILKTHRDTFYTWCEKVNKAYTEGDKKISLETLKILTSESLIYPQNADTVKQVRKDATNAVAWADAVGEIIKSGKKISIVEAKAKLDAGNRLKFTCPEIIDLRSAYNAAKAWSKNVKKSGLDEGSAQIYRIRELIKEHDSFIISMPEEMDALKQALCAYCICRRPYEGFMIGCDDCEEWYHGPCIGVSQAQGNKIDKYVCIRCSVKKGYNSSCKAIAAIIRKWCDPKEMSKSRSQDSQKHQRKIREKKREIVKWKDELQTNVLKLQGLKAEEIRQQMDTNSVMPQAATIEQEGNSLSPQITEINGNIVKATTSLEHCNRRMEELAELGRKRKATQQKEDALECCFRYWCLLLRTRVLIPETQELSEKSRPKTSIMCRKGTQLLSGPMHEVICSASKYGIENFPDVMAVKNSLECISWCHFAFSVLSRKPTIEEIRSLIELSSKIKLPEVKSIGMMRSMISRTTPWQAKVCKILAPIPGEKNPFNMTALNELQADLNFLPLTTPQESILRHAIEDNGARHCKCGSPRDVKSMECCDKCGSWYHLLCNSLDTCLSPGTEFKCPNCGESSKMKDKNTFINDTLHDVSPHAPDPLKLWPPFGLVGSAEALKALGTSPIALKIEDIQEPKHPDIKESAHNSNYIGQNGFISKVESQPINQNASKIDVNSSNDGNNDDRNNKNCRPSEQISDLCLPTDRGNNGNSMSKPDTKSTTSPTAIHSTNHASQYTVGNVTKDVMHPNTCIQESRSISMMNHTNNSPVKVPVGINPPPFGNTLDLQTIVATTDPMIGVNRASFLHTREVAQDPVNTAFCVNVGKPIVEGKPPIDTEEAAKAAVEAALGNQAVVNMFKGTINQPMNSYSGTATMSSFDHNRGVRTNNEIGILKTGIQNNIPSSFPFQSNHNSIPNNNITMMNSVQAAQTQGNAIELSGINRTLMVGHHLSQDPQFIASNVNVTGNHADNIQQFTPQAVVQTVPVKSTPKPSVLLKKFG